MKCSVCQQEIREGNKFCQFCGTPVPARRSCPICGKAVASGDRFCDSCGWDFELLGEDRTVAARPASPMPPRRKKFPWLLAVICAAAVVLVALLVALGIYLLGGSKSSTPMQDEDAYETQQDDRPEQMQQTPAETPEADADAWIRMENSHGNSIEVPGGWPARFDEVAVSGGSDSLILCGRVAGEDAFRLECRRADFDDMEGAEAYVGRAHLDSGRVYNLYVYCTELVEEAGLSESGLRQILYDGVVPTLQTADGGDVLRVELGVYESFLGQLIQATRNTLILNVLDLGIGSMAVPQQWQDGEQFVLYAHSQMAAMAVEVYSSKTPDQYFIFTIRPASESMLPPDSKTTQYLWVYVGDEKHLASFRFDDTEIYLQDEKDSLIDYVLDSVFPTVTWTAQAADSDYLLPESNSRYLTAEDLQHLTHEELCFARNEIYARHGWIFSVPEVGAFFAEKDWYVGTTPGYAFDSSVLNEFERANVSFISDYEDLHYGGSYY